MPDILLTTLGITWQIVPELYALTNPQALDLYANHPGKNRLHNLRAEYALNSVDRVWVVTTKGAKTRTSLDLLWEWWSCLPQTARPDLCVWQVGQTLDLASEAECRRMREAVFRMVLAAFEEAGPERMVLSLAGGRKTMSSDMHQAAAFFGTKALVHVVDNPEYSQELRDFGPQQFTGPLPASVQDAVTPLVTGCFDPNPLVQAQAERSRLPLCSRSFPLAWPQTGTGICELEVDIQDGLVQEVEQRTRQAEVLLCNYMQSMRQEEGPSNFLAFRLLRRQTLHRLKNLRIGGMEDRTQVEKAWLRRLPKAELHCHLGGVADARELVEIAAVNEPFIAQYTEAIAPWLDTWRRLLDRQGVDGVRATLDVKSLRTALPGVPQPLCLAAFILLFARAPQDLDRLIFGPCQEEERYWAQGFLEYEGFGDLQGSGLLQNEASIRAACRVIARKAEANNVRYLELRCSPVNYTQGGLTALEVVRCMQEELSQSSAHIALLFIASRHGSLHRVQEHVDLAQEVLSWPQEHQVSLCGFDLAGGEDARGAEQMRQVLMPMLEQCLHMTIHAGETQDVQSIWEAVYHLSAERVGHGLTLAHNPALLEKFRDRDMCIEMCPSSNMQIVGFQDALLPGSQIMPVYPLKDYLDQGLRVTVNTDNPGISRTDMTNELHRAARLTPGGLSLWEICSLVRNGFRAAFAPRDIRQDLLRRAEEEVIEVIQQGIWP